MKVFIARLLIYYRFSKSYILFIYLCLTALSITHTPERRIIEFWWIGNSAEIADCGLLKGIITE
jgi:hypothetical protein